MTRPRADTGNLTREPHSVSLKVLRLARPSLALQHPLPTDDIAKVPTTAAQACPSNSSDQEFLLSYNLSLPPAFGSAYVGEAFSCSLCANNELVAESSSKSISNVRITADMQTPSQQQTPLPISGNDDNSTISLAYGASLQRIIRFDLKEEGNHVLVVNLTYTETTMASDVASGGKVRSFRKLYQFQAQPCLSVRTKATELPAKEIANKSLGRSSLVRYVLEAQIENVSEGSIVLEQAKMLACEPFEAASLNCNTDAGNPLLSPRDIFQFAFPLEQDAHSSEGIDELKTNLKRDGRTALGQIALEWRSAMGEKGQLTTGTLFSRKRG